MVALADVIAAMGIGHLKPLATALLLPPAALVPFWGWSAFLIARRWVAGWCLFGCCLAVLWLSGCQGVARWIENHWMPSPPALSPERIQALAGSPHTAIVILGGGSKNFAPEYQQSDLSQASLSRLRYGVWLAGKTQLPVAFSGGVGWGQSAGASEAQTAQRIATLEFKRPLRWTESESRDTVENALFTVPMLRSAHIERVVLVTHGWHMRRATRAFKAASPELHIEPAPIGDTPDHLPNGLEWIPTAEGFSKNRLLGKEWLGVSLGF